MKVAKIHPLSLQGTNNLTLDFVLPSHLAYGPLEPQEMKAGLSCVHLYHCPWI